MPKLYFEDFAKGDVHVLGTYEVTAEEIVEFASQWDPQPFHIDPEAAKDSSFGGLIASGWHTGSIFMRLYVTALISDSDSRGSPGVEELRWLHPVRPGDVLRGEVHIEDVRPSSKHADRGTVFSRAEMYNQDEVLVMTWRARGLFGRREPASS